MKAIIFSVYQSCKSETVNKKNHDHIKKLLSSKGIQYTECEGMYGGVKEKSIMIDIAKFPAFITMLGSIIAKYKQESYLFINKSDCILMYDTKYENIGKWTKVDQEPEDAYTKINNVYYKAV